MCVGGVADVGASLIGALAISLSLSILTRHSVALCVCVFVRLVGSLYSNNIGDAGAVGLGTGLARNSSLKFFQYVISLPPTPHCLAPLQTERVWPMWAHH